MFLINKKNQGFTLIEVLLYLVLFALIIVILYPILITVLNNYLISREEIDLGKEIRNIFLKIQGESLKAKGVNILTDWEVVYDIGNEWIVFFLTQPIYLDFKTNKVKGFANNLSVGSISLSGNLYGVSFSSTSTCSTTATTSVSSIYSFSGYAWSPNIGWLKFRNDPGESIIYGVCLVDNREIRGFAYNDIVGWISFNCADLNICSISNYKVIEKDGYLYGYAWNNNIGWIIFDGTGGKVYLAKKNPYPYFIDLISDPRVFVQDLKFTQLQNSLKVNLKVQGPTGAYNESETAIILPLK
jgi:prepilin-type N-terminal cleavage/methylation domain-containing protein